MAAFATDFAQKRLVSSPLTAAEIAADPGRMHRLHRMAEAKTRGRRENRPMEMEDLTDEQLAASAHVWRRRAFHGEKHARSVALRLESELRRRAGMPETECATFDDRTTGKRRSPWWRFWWEKPQRGRAAAPPAPVLGKPPNSNYELTGYGGDVSYSPSSKP